MPQNAPAWKDLRDGSPPPGLLEGVARNALAQAKIPPLEREDAIALVGLNIASRFLYPAALTDGRLDTDALLQLDGEGLCISACADQATSRAVGFFPSGHHVSRDDVLACVVDRYTDWDQKVLKVALKKDRAPDARLDEIRREWFALFELTYRPDGCEAGRALQQAFVDNVGGSENDPRHRETLGGPQVRGVLELLARLENFSPELLLLEGGRLSVNRPVIKKASDAHLGKGASIKKGDRRLRTEKIDQPDPADFAELQELRMLRPLREALASHPLLQAVVDELERADNPDLVYRAARAMHAIAGALRDSEDPATSAAIVYLLRGGLRTAPDGPAITRAFVAEAYGVTPARVRRREAVAKSLLAQAMAA